ncbi:hypothetical protein [Parasitella parasitica]|uniref:Uncharacterized protein n=1 Tax=Parasitella parasitica TaxID=35722 RepID=A0A0B7NRB6_9FUNG|nr:hypothetical protein [Parasitella parasitica]
MEIEANKDKDENKIRRFVAGHVCFEMLNEIRGNFLPQLLKENYPEELKRLESVAAKENERSTKVDMRFRYHRFKIDWGVMRENLKCFRDNYRTTDTKHDVLYPYVVVNNSVAAQEASQEIQSELKTMNLLGFLERQVRLLHTAGVDHSNPHLRSRSRSASRSASRCLPRSASRSPPHSASGSRHSTRSAAGNSPLASSFSPASSLPVFSSLPASSSLTARSPNISSADYILQMTDNEFLLVVLLQFSVAQVKPF